ncbi:replication protein RepB, partial [Enterococcus faecium]
MYKNITKARRFGFLLYPVSIPENWREQLESLG